MSIKILIADDFDVIREGVKSFLNDIPEMEVIGQAKDGRIAVQLAYKLKPDVIIMDIEMPCLNGIDATRQIVQKLPDIKVIAFSSYLDSLHVREMFKAGALGYVSKYSDYQELITAIKTVTLEQIYLSSKITSVVIEGYVHRSPDDISPYSLLTVKERQVLQLIAEGETTKIIALKLNISTKAVEWRRSKVMQKLNTHHIADLIKYAIREGIIGICA